MSFQSSCPTCGAPIEFSVGSSLVAVCESCDSVVGRADGKLETYGKVADLVQTDSPLQLHVEGRIKGLPFEIVGRTQLKHAGGGIWDEWYLSIKGGDRWGWLSESQGRYHITFPQKTPGDVQIPAPQELSLHEKLSIPRAGVLTVGEVGQAQVIAAEGEIPTVFRPGEMYPYADLSGPGHKYATIDGSTDPPQVFVGMEVTLKQLGIDETVLDRDRQEQQVSAAGVNCPQCGGTLELTLPDQAQRVTCPYCDSLLDANQGNLTFLKKLAEGPEPIIPLGSKGILDGVQWTVIGFMQRMVKSGGQSYFWSEYLLYAPRTPFHWLVHSNNHWTLATGVAPGSVTHSAMQARHAGRGYRIFERGFPQVTYVLGEFYWKVNVGDVAQTVDYVNAPHMLSCEREHFDSDTGKNAESQEVNWTLGHYVTVDEIEKAFGIDAPPPRGVAANEPYRHSGIYLWWAATVGAALLLAALFSMSAGKKLALNDSVEFPKQSASVAEHTTKPFELRSRRNIRVWFRTATGNAWAYVEGTLYNEKTGKTYKFTVPIKHSQGGLSRGAKKYLSAIPAGTYVLKLKTQWQNMPITGLKLTVDVHQGFARFKYLIYVLVGVSIVPIVVMIMQGTFVARRWSESDFSPLG